MRYSNFWFGLGFFIDFSTAVRLASVDNLGSTSVQFPPEKIFANLTVGRTIC
jgi:hypothetical protein